MNKYKINKGKINEQERLNIRLRNRQSISFYKIYQQ